MDDPIIIETAQITVLRDQQFLKNNKINLNLKAHLKKAKVVK